MKALFIGRFQPFHNGHLKILQTLSSQFDEVIIGIGSSQYKNTAENPFSFEERKKMIQASLQKEKIHNFKILAIPDIHNPPQWVNHVLSIVADFDIVISNNQLTQQLFKEKGYHIRETQNFERHCYSGEEIRKRIIQNKPWVELVPPPVAQILQEINGIKRIKILHNIKC